VRNRIGILLSSIALFVTASAYAVEPFRADQSFGATMPTGGEILSLKQAIGSLGSASSGTLKISGQVTEVCQAKGCWMLLVDGDVYARITFKDYGFFVPTQTSMQRTVVYGILSEETLSVHDAEHFAEDAAKAGKDSAFKFTGKAVKEYSIVAASVQLENQI